MAVIRGDTNATLKDLTVIAETTLAEYKPVLHPRICSGGAEEGAYTKIPISTLPPFPSKLDGERKVFGKDVTVVQEYDQETYGILIGIDADLVRNSKAYNLSDLIAEAALAARMFPDYTLQAAIVANGNAYDAVAYYGTTHKFAKAGSSTINNTVSRTGATVTALATDLASAMAKLRTFKDNQGKLLNPLVKYGQQNLVIHCPAALEQAFRQVLYGSMIPVAAPVTTSGTAAAPAQNNVLQGIADLIPDGYLDASSETTWYLHYVGLPQKPFVMFENYAPKVEVLGFGSEEEIKNNRVLISIKHRFVLGNYRFDRSIRVA